MSEFRERIISQNIEEEMKTSYIDYAMSVIVGRALPEVRDGLKPVHRRILYAMFREDLLSNRSYSKSAGVVGEVLKKYHPHGDSAVYDTMVRMAQPWAMRYPLIDGQGNYGSVDGDRPAAYRYTEARLSPIAEFLLQDIDKDTVDFVDNFDGKVQEPVVLPAAFPNMLVNGSAGIAVGMATNIPPHNLGEVIDALVQKIDKPDSTTAELMKKLPGPDFPTGGYIYGREGIRKAYETGRGKVVMRARCKVEAMEKGNREAIIVTEIPYMVNKASLQQQIADLVRDKKIGGISDMRDESDREGMRIVIELKRGEVPEVVINNLYKHTKMQDSFSVILLSIVSKQPRYQALPSILQEYIDHRIEVIVRRTNFELARALKRIHIVHGLFVVLDNVDAVIAIIRKSESTETARTALMEKFSVPKKMAKEFDPTVDEAMPLSKEQAQAILDMRLGRLTALEQDKLLEERKELVAAIDDYRDILSKEQRVSNIVKDELLEVKKKFNDDRRTEIIDATDELTVEDLIAEENMVVTISNQGYIKRTATSAYRTQKRGGKGLAAMATKDEDWVEQMFIATTHNYILFFTNKGKAYWLKVYELPEAGRNTKGRPIINMLELDEGERIMAMIPVREFSEKEHLIMVTKKGQVVKNALSLYSNPRKTGIKAIKVVDDDELIMVRSTGDASEIVIATHRGMAIRFNEKDLRPLGRFTQGVRGINLAKGDYVVGMEVCQPDGTIITVSENGFGKRSKVEDYRLVNRGGKGVINIKCTKRNGNVVGIKQVKDDDELIMITQNGQSIRFKVSSVRVMGRATQGVTLHDLGGKDKIVMVERVNDADAEDE
jgi:DNA gyrase subunit A